MSVEIVWTCDNQIPYTHHVYRAIVNDWRLPDGWRVDEEIDGTFRHLCPTCAVTA